MILFAISSYSVDITFFPSIKDILPCLPLEPVADLRWIHLSNHSDNPCINIPHRRFDSYATKFLKRLGSFFIEKKKEVGDEQQSVCVPLKLPIDAIAFSTFLTQPMQRHCMSAWSLNRLTTSCELKNQSCPSRMTKNFRIHGSDKEQGKDILTVAMEFAS
jgi:hypothetical protein